MNVIIVDPWMLWGKDEVWVVDIMVDPWVNWRANVADVIMVVPWMVWGRDEVWVDIIIVLGPGCCGGRMMSGWTLSWFWPVGAEGNG